MERVTRANAEGGDEVAQLRTTYRTATLTPARSQGVEESQEERGLEVSKHVSRPL